MLSLCNIFKNIPLCDLHRFRMILRHDVRWASKKTSGSTQNRRSRGVPKHRGIKLGDGAYATAGSRLVVQNKLRFHPGLHVGLGRNGTLFAIESGRVVVTCEKIDPNWDHTWIQLAYAGRLGQTIYKKFFNIIPDEQHKRFKLVDEV